MLTNEIARSICLVEDLRAMVHDIDIPDNSRTRVAGACFAIAQEHHQAIVRLIEWKLYAGELFFGYRDGGQVVCLLTATSQNPSSWSTILRLLLRRPSE